MAYLTLRNIQKLSIFPKKSITVLIRGGDCCGCDNTGAGFRTTYAISTYHYKVLSSNPAHAKCTRIFKVLNHTFALHYVGMRSNVNNVGIFIIGK
jgi:hypothetical protein